MDREQTIKILVQRGNELVKQPNQFVSFTGFPESDRLLNDLEHYPHAFVLACLMDRQMLAEKCWLIPYYIQEKIGGLRLEKLTGKTPERLMRESP